MSVTPPPVPSVAILSDTPGGDALVTSKVVTLADQDNESQFDYLLLMVADKLTLRDQRGRTAVDICVDFSSPESRHKLRAGAKHPLCRAVSGRTGQLPTVCDATAGLGRDAFVLATSGCRLTLIERSPIVHALLQDGLRRATLDPHIADIAQRLRLIHGDACALLPTLADEQIPDVVYLDPMYPASRKSAAVKKGMRALQTLLAAEKSDAALSAEPLLPIAIEHARRRVVVKRPTSADSIGTHPPSGNITSGKTRYDIYAGQARQRDDEQSPGV